MLRRSNKHDPCKTGLVLSLENHSQDTTVRLQSGYCLATSVGNLIPVASYTVESRLANGGDRHEKQGIMANRIGCEFTHFISLSLVDEHELKEIEKFQETLKSIPGIGKPKKIEKMHVTML